ncbi:MAG TPA: sigma 54-interacting transcriptional regulator [Polyangiaceae bacterium]|nr:sigma 54-interacting transcriptional regulator [Polyangiaceae bacterium]
MPSRARTTAADPTLLLAVIGELGGAAIVLDGELAVRGATPAASRMLGVDIPTGVALPKLLCGRAEERPVADALLRGKAVSAKVPWLSPAGERLIGVRTTPVDGGWLVLLHDDSLVSEEEADAPVLFEGMWTRDPGMKALYRLIERAAASEANVLIRGETGAGKELVAKALHERSARKSGPFRAINCAALPPNLLESELFGHERGAFTGAVRDSLGHFRAAQGGTLFLDEVAELPLELQSKLLRVVETRTVIPVGARDAIPVDVRLVAATHRSLRKEVEAGRFRADLMFRLRVVPLFLPPLRARAGDVALLTHKLLEGLAVRSPRRVEHVADSALSLLESYPWPGNIRELRNALEYALVMGDGPVLVPSDLPPEIADPRLEEAVPLVNRPAPIAPEGDPDPERARIQRALDRAGGNRERAAKLLGVSRATLWRKLRKANA